MNLSDSKQEIRRRLFLTAVSKGNITPQFGYQLCPGCPGCDGRGSVCVERSQNGVRSAAFESCANCQGSKIVPV